MILGRSTTTNDIAEEGQSNNSKGRYFDTLAKSWGLDSVIRRMKSWVFVDIDSVCFFYKYIYKICDISHGIE